MISLKTPQEIDLMRTSGRIAAEILRQLAKAVRPGITTIELDKLAEELIFAYAKKYEKGELLHAFKGYQGFPGVLCASVNEVIVHGIPDDTPLKEGDNVGIDFGVIFKGWYSDTAVTVPVGKVSFETQRILRVCKKALRLGIKKAKPGSTTGDIGNTIERFVEDQGYELVRNLCGHGIGRNLHEEPEVPNFGKRHRGVKLEPGMVIAIEPMIVQGKALLRVRRDGHGYEAPRGSLTAHFEHTVAITESGPEVLT